MKHLLIFAGILAVQVANSASGTELEMLLQKPLADLEPVLKSRVADHIKQVDRQIRTLDWFLDTYYKDYNYTEEDATEYVSKPINTYMLIKRTSLEWPNVKAVVFNATLDKDLEEIEQIAKKVHELKEKDGVKDEAQNGVKDKVKDEVKEEL